MKPVALLVAASCALWAAAAAAQTDPPGDVIAFVDFAVIPMDTERVLGNHTVLVQDGLVRVLGPVSRVRVPEGARVIRGDGRFLLPALADMHTHSADEREMPLFVAGGVTTILNLGWSPPDFVASGRHRFSDGTALGPVVFESKRLSQPWGSRPGVATRQQARDSTAAATAEGYDFIKVYYIEADSVIDEIGREARKRDIPIVAHVTPGVGIFPILDAGTSMIAHSEELWREGLAEDAAAFARAIDAFLENGTWLTPTLATMEAIAQSWGNRARIQAYIDAPEAAPLSWDRVNSWMRTYPNQSGSIDDRLEIIIDATAKMHAAGVPLLLGTDGPVIPGMVPGHAAHEELRMLQEAGLSPFEALATGTRNAGAFIARYVPEAQPFGMVREGYRADFIIVERNPLVDPGVLRNPVSVVRRGEWIARAELDAIRNERRRQR